MRAITHAADFYEYNSPSHSKVEELYQNYEIYIGFSADYSRNTKCSGGPFLDVDDYSSYVFDAFAYRHEGGKDNFGKGRGMVWPYGKENWCNLEGTHLHFVADLRHLSSYDSITTTICTVGVFGTRYVRDK